MKRLATALVLCLFTALAACSVKMSDQPIADLVNFAQDAGAYHGLSPNEPLLTAEVQQAAYARFIEAHFSPWHRLEPTESAEDVFWGLAEYDKKNLFGENTLLRDPSWMEQMRLQSHVESYPSMSRKAIAVVNTSMRVLPTNQPAFYDFAQAGEGFPFDYMQNSLVLAGTPLYASHMSADRAWIMVESRFTYGWVPVQDIGWVDDAFSSAFQTASYITLTRDDVPVTDDAGQYSFTAHIGTILPTVPDTNAKNGFTCLIPARSDQGNAVLHRAFLPDAIAQSAPIKTTPANFARLANAMLGRPYGWGGLYEGRDCSAATMDLMAAFGIYLPRNSSQQIKVGTLASLDSMSRAEKKQFIIKNGTPFLTLIRKPGHIMLYLGQYEGEPMIFHAVWGLKTDVDGIKGRKILGRAVITTLEPGLERDDIQPKDILLESVSAISTLP